MEGLTPGRIVHVVSTQAGDEEHLAAIVTGVEDADSGRAVLHVFSPNGATTRAVAEHDPNGAPGTWHWIEGSTAAPAGDPVAATA